MLSSLDFNLGSAEFLTHQSYGAWTMQCRVKAMGDLLNLARHMLSKGLFRRQSYSERPVFFLAMLW